MTRAAPYAGALVAGLALSFAFPEPDASFLAWIALVPLLAAGSRRRLRTGFALGFVFGLGFFGALLTWIANVGYAAWVMLVLLQAVFTGLFGLAWAASSRLDNTAVRVLSPAAAWIAMEMLRGSVPFGGLTWGELAQSQHDYGWMLRPAAFTGRWGVSFLCVTCSALLLEAWRHKDRARPFALCSAGAVAVIAAPLLLPANHAAGETARVAIVQGNVPEHWDENIREKELRILQSHVDLTEELAVVDLDLVVWPESSVSFDPRREPFAADAIRTAARAVGVPMVVGGNEDIDRDRYRVVAWQVSAKGDITDTYVKTHLVPFGEYVPGRRYLGWLPLLAQVPRDAVPSSEGKVFPVGGGEVAPVLSYEGDFGSLVRARVDQGGRAVIVATNTSTWARSWASVQHLAMSQVRAAENGVWVIHAAISGISAFVAPDGTVVQETPLWTATAITQDIAFAEEPTFYARTGDWFAYACALATILLLAAGARRPIVRDDAGPPSSVA
ncbi:MAG TPA: apolipoprotein N-acyltransferase [Actinomycetota bacterium]